ncbi:helix-turn-helix domain-containing protein [Anaerobium acetethylicum]|uniref:Cupin domain protein n=1 Tax=Anaerobium acetethylicum TaxID=1619234 RepID=A0A1D3TR00_9FIRM|nr:XRE family transcriptional regulator [Anaerobium acetethylicum]SCP96056.1 Cupin domain protein [Anaerobium acetethylicum]
MSDLDLTKIGNILKTQRLAQNLSLRDLSAKSNIAASTISQIETGKTSPNLMSLKALCDSLKLPVSALFLDDAADRIKLVRKSEQQTFVRNVSNGKESIESLITKGTNEMWGGIINVPAKTDSGNYSRHGGEEFVFILKGTLTFDLEGNETYLLEERDTLYYPNYIGHRWRNDTDEDVEFLIVTTSPYNF